MPDNIDDPVVTYSHYTPLTAWLQATVEIGNDPEAQDHKYSTAEFADCVDDLLFVHWMFKNHGGVESWLYADTNPGTKFASNFFGKWFLEQKRIYDEQYSSKPA